MMLAVNEPSISKTVTNYAVAIRGCRQGIAAHYLHTD